jgi:hypothetical protein
MHGYCAALLERTELQRQALALSGHMASSRCKVHTRNTLADEQLRRTQTEPTKTANYHEGASNILLAADLHQRMAQA